MTNMFEQRRRDLAELDQQHYKEATGAEDEGYEDGFNGRPDRTAEIGSLGHYYGGGHEEGTRDRAALESD